MTESIDYSVVLRMLQTAARLVRDNQSRLSKLDSFGGDGDHGITMARAMDRVEEVANADRPDTPAKDTTRIGSLLRDVGWGILGVDGGATGPLFGTFFTSMGDFIDAAGKEPLDTRGLAAAFNAGLEGVLKYTNARAGDKTMIDALEPAVCAVKETGDGGGKPAAALAAAAEAASRGAAATREMQARFGRAKNMGEKSVGNEDPGAASVALIFKGFADGAKSDG